MRITDVIIVSCCCSSRCSIIKCYKMFLYIIVLYLTTLIGSTLTTPTFSPSSTTELRRLTVDPLTGTVYVGAVNHLYQLDSDLNLVVDVISGPVQDNKDCTEFDDTGELECTGLQLSSTDNYNQVTMIGPRTNLISPLILFFLLGRPSSKSQALDLGSVLSKRIGVLFGSIVLQVNMHRLSSPISNMMSYFQDGGHDVHLPLASSLRWLPVRLSSVCTVNGS